MGTNAKNIQKYIKETTNAFNDMNELQKKKSHYVKETRNKTTCYTITFTEKANL